MRAALLPCSVAARRRWKLNVAKPAGVVVISSRLRVPSRAAEARSAAGDVTRMAYPPDAVVRAVPTILKGTRCPGRSRDTTLSAGHAYSTIRAPATGRPAAPTRRPCAAMDGPAAAAAAAAGIVAVVSNNAEDSPVSLISELSLPRIATSPSSGAPRDAGTCVWNALATRALQERAPERRGCQGLGPVSFPARVAGGSPDGPAVLRSLNDTAHLRQPGR